MTPSLSSRKPTTTGRLFRTVLATIGWLLLVACAPVSPAAPGRAPEELNVPPTPTAEQLIALGKDTFPAGVPCDASGQTVTCAITARLRSRLESAHVSVCRCTQKMAIVSITADSVPGGGTTHIRIGNGSHGLDIIAVSEPLEASRARGLLGWGLLIDDVQCLGRGVDSSIFRTIEGCL